MLSVRSAYVWLLVVSFAASARAEYPKDRAALRMIDKAVNEHYLKTEFDRAESLLTGTVLACERKCRPTTLARAWMYVGIVRGSGKSDGDGALEAFGSAISLAADAELDADLATPETRELWERARRSARPDSEIVPKAEAQPAPKVAPPPPERELCPPGLPGCAQEGDRCESTRDCKDGLACGQGSGAAKATCQRRPTCDEDADCASGACNAGLCALEPKRHESSPASNWLGLYAALDFAKLPQQADACGGVVSASRYQCYENERLFDAASTGRASPGINSGFVRSTLRVLLGFEHAFSDPLRAGGRVGFAFLGSAQGFLPVHAELRLSYSPRALRAGRVFAPYAFAGGGFAQVDARFPLQVNTAGAGESDSYRTLDAVAIFGRNFGAWGAGLRLSPSADVEFDVGLSALALFPDLGLVLQPWAGLVLGL